MKTRHIISIIILAFVFNLQGFAQIKKAEKSIRFYNYSKAIPYLLKAVESEDPEIKNTAIPMLANCYRLTNNVGEARQWYEKAVKISGTEPINYYYMGQAYRSLGMYPEAAEAFLSFKLVCPDSLDAQKYYNYSVEIQNWLDFSPMAEVKNVETINTRYSDFGPAFYKSGIVFTSDRKKDQLDDTYGWTNFSYLDLHYTEPEYYKNLWSPMKPEELMKTNFNQQYHDGPAVFTSDFKRVYLTRTVHKDGSKDKDNINTSLLKIYFADIEEGQKMKFQALPFNNNNYSVAHPALSPDDKQIIFSSDMPGGYGGSDLYIAKLENGNWSKPKNLGKIVNTVGDDVFPYWASDSVLFFASTDHMGYGGLDIFRTTLLSDSTWSEPENLKAPINTSYDDFGIIFSENKKEGLFSSNRPEGKGADDIYAFRNLIYSTTAEPSFMVNGFVKEKFSMNPIDFATVFFFDSNSNEIRIAKTDATGYFEVEAKNKQIYVVKAMKDSFMYDCMSFRTPEKTEILSYQIPRDLMLNKLTLEQSTKVEIYYDLDKWEIRDDAKPVLDSLVRFMEIHPIQAELSSHTDCRATFEYNLNLSQKRAEAAVQYIVSKGISTDRITAKGYGESKLINKCADGVVCSEAEHQENRRTEFKIIGINPLLFNENRLDLDVFRAGDIIKPNLLDVNFFGECNNKSGVTN